MALPRIIDSEPSCWTVLPYTCNACIEQIRKTGDKINGIVDPKIYCVVSCNTLFTTAPFPLHCAREDPWCKGQNYYLKVTFCVVGLGGLGVTCSPRDPKFAGSNPAEVDAFFQDVNILSTSPPGGILSWGSRVWDFRLVKEPQVWKNWPLNKI